MIDRQHTRPGIASQGLWMIIRGQEGVVKGGVRGTYKNGDAGELLRL